MMSLKKSPKNEWQDAIIEIKTELSKIVLAEVCL